MMEPETRESASGELIPLRMLNEWTYCPRLGVLEWLHGEFEDNADTVEGSWQHRRVDKPGPPLEDIGEEVPEGFKTRALWVSSEREGLTGKLDLVEATDGAMVPVDTKKGSPAPVEGGVWEPERVQLCAQGLLLRDAGYTSDYGYIWFVGARRRVRVDFGAALVAQVRSQAAAFRRAVAAGDLPSPLVDSPKCPRCSLVGICLPDETVFLSRAREHDEGKSLANARQLLAPRPESHPLYVGEPGAKVGVSKGEVVVRLARKELVRTPTRDVGSVALFGNVQISSQALRALAREGIGVSWLSRGGWFYGQFVGPWHKNVVLREAQYAAAASPPRALAVAREIVRSKIRNQRTLLRRNGNPSKQQLRELRRLSEAARDVDDASTLLGLEGAAGRLYFQSFATLLRQPFDWTRRNRRPPRDPVNALLSYAYAMLVKDLVAALTAVGFDPAMGLYHRPRYGRPALALDMMEEFRPLVADSVVLMAINNGEVRPQSFVTRADGCNLTPAGRRAFLAAYERRLEQVITHPIFGYSASWRRVIDVQCRLLGRHLLGELPSYVPIETR